MKKIQEQKVTVPCAHCFEDCTLGKYESLDGSSVCEKCAGQANKEYEAYLKGPLDPRD